MSLTFKYVLGILINYYTINVVDQFLKYLVKCSFNNLY